MEMGLGTARAFREDPSLTAKKVTKPWGMSPPETPGRFTGAVETDLGRDLGANPGRGPAATCGTAGSCGCCLTIYRRLGPNLQRLVRVDAPGPL